MIAIHNVAKKYFNREDEKEVLKDINLTFEEIGLVLIKGESGAGKTTLLNLIGGLDNPSTGNILFNNQNITDEDFIDFYRLNDVSIIFQDKHLFEDLTVFDNLKLYRENSDEDINQMLDKLKISYLKKKKVRLLSGGEKQRVAIARALLKKPKILICDEPTEFLDNDNAQRVLKLLKEISSSILVLVASHQSEGMESYADRIITLDNGKIQEDQIINEVVKNKVNKIKPYTFDRKFFRKIGSQLTFGYKMPFVVSSILLISCMVLIMLINIISHYDFAQIQADTIAENHHNIIYTNISFDDDSKRAMAMQYTQNFGHGYVNNENDRLSLKLCNLPIMNNFIFLKYTDDFNNLQIIGHEPRGANEIVIYEILAEKIIDYGIELIDHTFYKPNNYEELLNNELFLNEVPVKIVGIVKQDLVKYKQYKNGTNYDFTKANIYTYKLFDGEINQFNNYIIHNEMFDNYLVNFNYVLGRESDPVLITFDKKKQYEFLKTFQTKIDPLYETISPKTFSLVGSNKNYKYLPIYGTVYSGVISVALYYPYIIGNLLKYVIPIFILLMILIIFIYYAFILKKSIKKLTILRCLGCNKKNIEYLILWSLLYYLIISFIITIILSLGITAFGNMYLSNLVGFTFKPFIWRVTYLIILLLILLLTLIIAFSLIKREIRVRTNRLYFRNI